MINESQVREKLAALGRNELSLVELEEVSTIRMALITSRISEARWCRARGPSPALSQMTVYAPPLQAWMR
jgi:hypothetical protein